MAYQQETSAAPIKADTIEAAIDAFDPVLGRLETLANRASNCSDRILGGRPTGVEAAEKPPTPNHLLFAIKSRRDRLVRVVDHLEAELSRIESGLA